MATPQESILMRAERTYKLAVQIRERLETYLEISPSECSPESPQRLPVCERILDIQMLTIANISRAYDMLARLIAKVGSEGVKDG